MNGSTNVAAIPESATLAMTARAAALRSSGAPVISLSAGEPDFATPRYISEAAIQAIEEGHTHYPPAAGLAPLRAAISDYLNSDLEGSYAAEQVIVTVGAKQALFDAIFTIFGPGDRVAVVAPYWVSYPAIIGLARAEPVVLKTDRESGFKLTTDALADALRDGISGVVLNSPSNPTGSVYTPEELADLIETAEKSGAWVISDEIYSEIRYGCEFGSVARHASEYDRVVLINGFSKAYAMTGWRVGYAAAELSLVKAMTKLQGHVNTNTSLPSQYAALAALTDEASRRAAIDSMVAAFASRRGQIIEAFAEVPGIEVMPPDGAFYLWIEASRWCDALGGDSSALCLDILDHENVALVPGSAFGSEGYLRLSFAASESDLAEGVARMRSVAQRLGVG